ncbi:MAG: dihydroorotase [Oscillospiraceae bacterium]|nr:dihydroorotase [Oscillospiraceae bacterium]
MTDHRFSYVGCSREDVHCPSVPVSAVLSDLVSDEHHYFIFPGFCDVHVHFREPGFSYKETILTGCRAAAAGGYTAVCTMPNLNPVPDSLAHLNVQLQLIREQATVNVYPYGAITVSQQGQALAAMPEMAPSVVGFSDDGRGVQQEQMMRQAMEMSKKLGKIIVAHCENNRLLFGGYIHAGMYAKAHGHKGICSASEYSQIQRDLRLVEQIGCSYHICHISTKESVEMIRQAKAKGLDVTCETAPHYLVLTDEDLQEDGRFKMNPPLRSASDREALIEGLLDGTIDMIATDHAPHSDEEKSKGLSGSAFGIVGLETAFPVLYTHLVKPGILSLEQLVRFLSENPRKRFKIPMQQEYTVWDLDAVQTIRPETFLSKGRATPFAGHTVNGKCIATICNGKIVYQSAHQQ